MPTEAAPSLVIAPRLEAAGAALELSPEESHYLLRVCRVREGDHVSATDGRGTVASLRVIAAVTPVRAEIERLERKERHRDATILCGAPEGERADWLVEKLAELGIASLQPVQCARGGWRHVEARLERWRRLARAALRQSRGCYEMAVAAPIELEAALAALPEAGGRWVADPAGPAAAGVTSPVRGAATCAIGPAGGFTPGERRALESRGFSPIALAASRLRTETAALAWAAWWAASASE